MSDPKEKKAGKAPERKPTGPNTGKRTQGNRGPRRSTGGTRTASQSKKPPLTSQQKILKGLYMALTVISAIIVLAYIGVNLFAAPPDIKPGPGGVTEVERPQVTTTIDPETGEEIEIEIPGLPADRKKEFYTFLLVGQSQDTGGKLSDTMMLAAYDVPNQRLSVMSLPRDTWVRYNGRTIMINGVYNAAGGDRDGKGIAGLKQAVKDLTGVYPDFHVIIQWEALGELVDAIGGVYYEVPFDMYYNDLSQHFKIDLKKGYQLLDGEGAMGLVRWRHNSDDRGNISRTYGYAEGDIGRIKTQQAFLKEVIKKCLQTDVLLGNLGEFINIFQKNVTTDLSVANMAYFGKSALGGLDMDQVSFVTLPNRNAGDGAHLLPVGSQIVKTVNDGFNPYKEAIRLGELRLADASPLVTPTPEPKETEEPDTDDSPAPSESFRPTESEDVVLPPGSFSRPSASPRPGESAAPGGGPRPTDSAAPSPKPSASNPGGVVLPSGTPVGGESTPVPTAEPTPPPADTAPPPAPTPDEEPLLPPM